MSEERMVREVHYDLMISETFSKRKDSSEDLEPYAKKLMEIINLYACI